MPIPTDISQGTNATKVNPANWNELVDGINGIRDYYSAEVVFDVTHEDYGATGDGSTDDEPAIDLAHTAATANGGVLFFPSGGANNTYKIGSNITFNSDVTLLFAPGATLAIQNGVTVTIDGHIAPTLHQIFALIGTGVAALAAGSVKEIVPQWWGAVGDGSNDDTTAIQAAITAAEAAKGVVFLPPGEYKISTALDIDNTISFIGSGKEATTIVAYGGIDGITITPSPAGSADFTRLAHFRIKSDTDVTGIGISLAAGCRRIVIGEVWVGSEFNDLNKSFLTGINITDNSFFNKVLGCYIRNCTNGIKLSDAANSNLIGRMTQITNADFGIKDESCTGNHYISVDIETTAIADAVGIYFDNSDSPLIVNCYFELHGSGNPYAIYLDNNVGTTNQAHISGNYYSVDGGTNAIFDDSGTAKHWIDTRSIQFADEFGSSASFKGKLYKTTDETNGDNDDVIYETDSGNNTNGHFMFNKTRTVWSGRNSRLELSYPLLQTPLGGFGAMLENRFTYSEEFGNADWVKSAATVSSNQMDGLDGRVTADKITQTGDSGYISQNITGVENNQSVWGSVWMRWDVGNRGGEDAVKLRWYNVTDGAEAVVDTFTLTSGNVWRRYELRYTNTTGGTKEFRFEIYPSDETFTSFVGVWGAQCVVEESNNPHSNHQGHGYPYIKTTDTTIALDFAGSTARNLALSDGLYILDSSPEVQLRNTTAEDGDGGRESALRFKGVQSGEELTTLALIEASHDGAADDEKGQIKEYTNDGNDGDSPTLRRTVDSAGKHQIGDGGTTNYIEISAAGFVSLHGTARATMDIHFDPSNLKIPAANFPAAAEKGVTPVFLFDKAADEELRGAFEIPHNYDPETDLKAHFHWAPVDANAGDVTWGIEWHITADNSDDVLTAGTTTQIVVDATESRQDESLKSGDITIDGTGIVLETTFHFRIFRDADASEGDASDTYDDDAALIFFDIECMVKGFGEDEQW